MSKRTDRDGLKNVDEYNGSSTGAVWLIVATSLALGVVAVLGSSSIT